MMFPCQQPGLQQRHSFLGRTFSRRWQRHANSVCGCRAQGRRRAARSPASHVRDARVLCLEIKSWRRWCLKMSVYKQLFTAVLTFCFQINMQTLFTSPIEVAALSLRMGAQTM